MHAPALAERPVVPGPTALEPESSARPARVHGEPVAVTVDNVVKAFGETAALHGVSLDIVGGELIALLGPSGSGKTTLLRVIAGLEFPTSGRILFGSEDASQRTVQQRNVGFVFQHYALFKHMTVFDNIAFGLRVRRRKTGIAEDTIRTRVMTLLDLVQLSGLDQRYPAQLSGGQRQRVALARALAIDPRILLLDEPFGALDYKVRKELRRWLRELHDETGHTTIFVTHDQEEALELADRVVVMSNGRIEQVGSADEIYDAPATPFVYQFIGDSSTLPVMIHGGKVSLDGRQLRLASARVPDGPARLFMRPHEFNFVGDETGAISGVIRNERRHGPRRRLEIAVGNGDHMIEVEVPPTADHRPGSRCSLLPKQFRVFSDAG